ncbi:MAG: hypothetical protein HOV79_16280 [Hamadaea sp.]|nr:hypothetical protein [Hamadaea sp.]
MARYRTQLTAALFVLAAGTVFAVFITFRDDAALIGALSAAGTVLAAAFAAVAAYGSVKAAAQSSASAQRAREGVARSIRPTITPSVYAQDGILFGKVESTGLAGVDITVSWALHNGAPVTMHIPRLVPGTPETVSLAVPDTDGAAEIATVWIEFWDDSRVAQWRDSWAYERGRLVLADSRLVD